MIREDAGHGEEHTRAIGDGDEHSVSGHRQRIQRFNDNDIHRHAAIASQ
jgi:hypothetical protein